MKTLETVIVAVLVVVLAALAVLVISREASNFIHNPGGYREGTQARSVEKAEQANQDS